MADPDAGTLAHPVDRLVGEAPAMCALRTQIRHLAAFDRLGAPAVPTLLLQGETGTGKGLVARVVHDSGPRAHGPFVQVNCAAIPEPLLEAELFGFAAGAFTDAKRAKPGLFEAASGGTLFLDEIDALPLLLQSKLLNAIEAKQVRRLGAVAEQPVDVKCIAATQEVLSRSVAAGRFRADLYYRLAVIVLDLPPLRERGSDVLVLAHYFLRGHATAHELSPKRFTTAAAEWLLGYDWPGNIRELSHLLERAMLLHPEASLCPKTLQQLCLPRPLPAAQVVSAAVPLSNAPLDALAPIRQALLQTGGNVARAARLLGMSRKALRYRMGRYAIARPRLEAATARGEQKAQESTARRYLGQALAPTEEAATPAPDWEQKVVVVLAIELVWPTSICSADPHTTPWAVAVHWEHAIVEQVQGFGGVLLPGTPALLTVVFGILQTPAQLPQRAVQAALAVQHLVGKTRTPAAEEAAPAVRLALHCGELLVDVRSSDPTAWVLAVGETLALPVRLLSQAEPGDVLVSPPIEPLVRGWCTLQACQAPLAARPPEQSNAYRVVAGGKESSSIHG